MSFNEIKKNFGFGCMRLPMKDGEVDYDEFNRMIDAFLDASFNYFDTAHGYIDGKSETAVRDCLAARHKREEFVLANKLSDPYFEKEEDILPLFEGQLKLCGVDYFDFYLFHCLNRELYKKHKRCNAFEIVRRLKEEGRVKHIAMSFHDTADILDMILTEQPFIEAVQLQINYLDYDDPAVQSKACYDVAVKHGKKVIVMEPVKGGTLVNLPENAAAVLDGLEVGSHASVALRYAASYPEVFMVLSGMGNMDMMRDNIATMGNFVPLNDKELKATDRVREIIREYNRIPCTGCDYCAGQCPKKIPISKIFAEYNEYLTAKCDREAAKASLSGIIERADECVNCGGCEKICPQGIKVREQLKRISGDMK